MSNLPNPRTYTAMMLNWCNTASMTFVYFHIFTGFMPWLRNTFTVPRSQGRYPVNITTALASAADQKYDGGRCLFNFPGTHCPPVSGDLVTASPAHTRPGHNGTRHHHGHHVRGVLLPGQRWHEVWGWHSYLFSLFFITPWRFEVWRCWESMKSRCPYVGRV